MRCPQCRAENHEGRRFCAECGALLVGRCASCGFSNEPGANFCGGCGAALARPAAPGAPAPREYTPPHLAQRIVSERRALEGERKQVTVLFADLKGSMELLAARDPEEARTLLDPVLERMMDAVHQYEGTVNQVMGDGIMALFGAPVAHEHHAARAGYAALKMLESITAYAREVGRPHGVDLQIRIGLNSGEVVVRGIGNDLKMDYSAVGQTTHLAARMEQLASPGTILVTEAFARLTEGLLHFKPLGLMTVKGLSDPVDVLQLVDAEPKRHRFQAASGRGRTRFVGREPELGTFTQALERAGAGQGQVVAVIGEPGIGKSRLLYEFLDSERTRDWLILEAGSLSYDQAIAFHPIRELLTGYFRIEEHDDPERIDEKITRRVLELGEALRGILPPLRSLLEIPVRDPDWDALDPSRRRQRILDGVKVLLVRQSQLRPLLLAVENLHWIDAQTQEFLDALVDSMVGARVLLLVNYRPEYQHGWGNKPYYTQLRLDPLAPESAQELLRTLLGSDPDLAALKTLLIERTEGNPFFLEESIRTLIEQKVLVGSRGERRLVKALSHIEVPATVQAILAARIDRLEPEDKRLLQFAAVIGRDLSVPLLRAATGLPEMELTQRLGHLQAAEFVYERALFPEIEYTFKHALTQEVAYGSLLNERRRGLHARILAAMEQLHDDRPSPPVEALAHHALQGAVWDKAVDYYQQAGTKAAARSAYREAVSAFEQGLAALAHLEETPDTVALAFDLRLEMRAWLVPLANYDRILANLEEAKSIAERLGDRRRLGLVQAYMTDYFRLTGQSEQAVACGRAAFAYGTELGDVPIQVLSRVTYGHACHAVGDYARAVEILAGNVAVLTGALVRERFGSAALPAVLSRGYLMLSLADLGRFAEAEALGHEGVRMAEELDTAHSYAVVSHALGLALLLQGDFVRAIPMLEQTLVRCQVGHIPLGSRLLASALGYAYVLTGRVEEGVPLLERAAQQAKALKVMFRYALWLAWLGEGHLLAGRTADATRFAEEALARSVEHGEAGHQAYALRLVGDIAAAQDAPAAGKAETAYGDALALAVPRGMRPLEAHCRLGLGELHRRTGAHETAARELAAAAELYRSMGMTFWLRRAEGQAAAPDRA